MPDGYNEIILLISNLQKVSKKILQEIKDSNEDSVELARVVNSILGVERFKDLYNKIDKIFDELQSESERLIESEEADTPEVLERREELKRQINDLLDRKAELDLVVPDVEESEIYLANVSNELRKKADNFINKIDRELKSATNPSLGNN